MFMFSRPVSASLISVSGSPRPQAGWLSSAPGLGGRSRERGDDARLYWLNRLLYAYRSPAVACMFPSLAWMRAAL
ncbi:hypothetical protein VTO73DRAFT_10485 [Trametes versicolor]